MPSPLRATNSPGNTSSENHRDKYVGSLLYSESVVPVPMILEDCEYFETIEEAAKYVSEIVGHEVEASVGAVSKSLDDYVEEHEEEEPDLFYSFHEFTVLES